MRAGVPVSPGDARDRPGPRDGPEPLDRSEPGDRPDPRDRRTAVTATGRLRELNAAGVLDASDVHVAVRLGRLAREEDERVLLAAALAVRAVRSGSVSLDLSAVPATDPDVSWPPPTEWEEAVERSPLLGTALRRDHGSLYLARYWHEESQVVEDLRRRARTAAPSVAPADLAAALDAYFPEGPAGQYADQRAAAATACTHWTSVVTGGPGTGKTTTVARLLGVLLALADAPLRIALAAPTGKAAARMAQAVREATHQPGFPLVGPAADRAATIRGLEATTLHRLLGSRPDNRTRFRHDRTNRLPQDVVVVDETSMMSLTMTARLLEAVRPSSRLVLVGDADQLASVEAGAVLKDLVDGWSGSSAVSRLTRTRRFGAGIGRLAEAVRTGDGDAVLAALHESEEVGWIPADELPALLRERTRALVTAAESGDRVAALEQLDRHRLLCAHRDGPYGVSHWNRVVERLLMAEAGQDWLPEWYVGRPFIVNANDYGLGLFNGDTGVVVAGSGGSGDGHAGRSVPGRTGLVGTGERPEGRPLATTRLADVSTAHAMTVHRSQGSQFDEVTVVLPEPDSRILTRELLYTAVTRARTRVRLVGTEDALRAAVGRRARRATGLARRLVGPEG